ncbi:DUF2789 domain-containing protein [Methylophaga sp.]|uniref:DUF2789 domain-containing protein n=1 Tax=Methylophaga sp. TaxID=2024840 RepID=UPI003A8DCE13
MDTSVHTMENLFLQLGLDNSEEAIEQFIKEHDLPENVKLENAYFWSPAQSAFIKECLTQDSDWAEVVDQLNVQLRQ